MQGKFGHFLAAIALLTAVSATHAASAATVNVSPGQTIASGIAAAAPGDTVIVNAGTYTGGVVLNKSVSVVANGPVTVNATSPRSGTALSIKSNDCSVTGITFLDFGWAVDTGSTDWARVTLKSDVFRRSGTVWVRGDSWTLDGIEIDRPMVNGLPADVEDYMNMWGSNHKLIHSYFHGLNLNTDLPGGAHNDAIQMFTEGGLSFQHLNNILIDSNIFADFLEAIWISNYQNVVNGISNITVTNNVFWGQDFTFGGSAVESSGCAMFQSSAPGIVINNNLFHHAWNAFSLYAMTGVGVAIQGNIVDNVSNAYSLFNGTTSSAVNRGTKGNIFWGVQGAFLSPLSPDTSTVNPQLRNPNAITGIQVVGPDGIPFTADDAWRTQNSAAATFGPQIGGTTPPPPPPDTTAPVITLNGAASMTLIVGQVYTEPGATAIDNVSGSVAVTISGTVNTAVAAVYTVTYTARDAAGNVATATRTVTVTAAAPPPSGTLIPIPGDIWTYNGHQYQRWGTQIA